MRLLFIAAAMLAFSYKAAAHLGNENNTEIRVYADSMRLVLRTSIPFAWSLLGENAPAMADGAGQAVARSGLVDAAPALVSVTSAGSLMSPTQVDCLFEVPDDVAFIFNFKRPSDWPVEVKMEFFDRLGGLEIGTIAVFDYTASRFARDVEPFAQRVVDRNHPALSFTLEHPIVPAGPEPGLTSSAGKPVRARPFIVSSFLLAGVLGVGLLAYRRIAGR